jgi:hypothetical protein
VVVGLTRTQREEAITLDPSAWVMGSPGGEGDASPWYLFTIKHEDISGPKGALTETATRTIATRVARVAGAAQ